MACHLHRLLERRRRVHQKLGIAPDPVGIGGGADASEERPPARGGAGPRREVRRVPVGLCRSGRSGRERASLVGIEGPGPRWRRPAWGGLPALLAHGEVVDRSLRLYAVRAATEVMIEEPE